MENFISTIVFLLPGFLMYFWVQSFGVNPVVKHSATEMGAISALLWLPVSLITLWLYNVIGSIYGVVEVWTLTSVKANSGRLEFLGWFIALSIPVSFAMSFVYIRFLYPLQKRIINLVRKSSGMAILSDTPSVWEEFFIRIDKRRDRGIIPVKIYKLDKPEAYSAGVIEKASRPFEPERSLVLTKCEELTVSYEEHKFQGVRKYIDTKSGLVVEELDLTKPTNTAN